MVCCRAGAAVTQVVQAVLASNGRLELSFDAVSKAFAIEQKEASCAELALNSVLAFYAMRVKVAAFCAPAILNEPAKCAILVAASFMMVEAFYACIALSSVVALSTVRHGNVACFAPSVALSLVLIDQTYLHALPPIFAELIPFLAHAALPLLLACLAMLEVVGAL